MFKKTDAKVAALTNSHAETEEFLRNTAAMVRETDAIVRNTGVSFDRHLKEDHNSG